MTKPLRVLAVDDSIAVRRIMKVILEMGGHQPILADGVQAAREVLASQQPDVILTDYSMPGLTGYDLVQGVRAEAGMEQLPIFVVSSEDAPEILSRMEAAGANGWFRKPVCAVSLLTMLNAIGQAAPNSARSPNSRAKSAESQAA